MVYSTNGDLFASLLDALTPVRSDATSSDQHWVIDALRRLLALTLIGGWAVLAHAYVPVTGASVVAVGSSPTHVRDRGGGRREVLG